SHDDFIRTTEPRHHQAVRELIHRIAAAGDLYVAQHDGWYCASCESFYTEKELREDRSCPIHEKPTEWHAEENVFFRLSKYQEKLLELYDRVPSFVRPESRANEVRSFVASGLRDLSVSRVDLPWGVSFPDHPKQTVYVWLDALTNYLSVLGFGEESADSSAFETFWNEPEGTRIHLVGKDILRFHAVYWPAFLLSAGLPLPSTVWAHGWWLRDQRKVSKSVGNIVRLDELMGQFGSDPVRYFLLRDMVFGQDASFSDEAFIDRFNSDLANDLGNTVSRIVKLCRRAFGGRTPPEACSNNPVKAAATKAIAEYRVAMDDLAFHQALASLWRLLAEVNQYLVSTEPWKLLKDPANEYQVARILWNALEGVRLVATGLLPFMPTLAPKVLAAVGAARQPEGLPALEWGHTPLAVALPASGSLFPRVDKPAFLAGEEADPLPESDEEGTMISIEDFFRSELKVATITGAEAIPKARKLLKVEIDLGEGAPRTLVAGIAEHYTPDELIGRQVVVVANLQPAKLMGVESQGMVLAASQDDRPILLHPDSRVPPGTPVK
ncbi:MAG: methionine--tRNA ligase, partial [Acidobacteriota bacterium]|nr:methionine--tRNA ligase [Acidobacteriota bacterium]